MRTNIKKLNDTILKRKKIFYWIEKVFEFSDFFEKNLRNFISYIRQFHYQRKTLFIPIG